MEITAIQKALQELGFLPHTHALGGEWDSQTNAGYIQAAQADNLHPALWAQPLHIDQLPRPVRELIEGGEPQAPATPPSQSLQTGPTAEEQAAAAAKAAQEEADRAAEQQRANHQAEVDAASAGKIDDIEKDVDADADELETDADTNTPDSENEPDSE
jgi:hypothetical protein